MLFHIYLFVLLAGIGIGSVEYIRWCERSLPTSADIPPEIALTSTTDHIRSIRKSCWTVCENEA